MGFNMSKKAVKVEDDDFELPENIDLDAGEDEELEDDVEENVEDDVDSIDSDDSEDDVEDSDEDDEGDDDEVVVSINGESPTQDDDDKKAPGWVRDLRKSHRETQRENRELKAKLDALSGGDKKPVELGKKPTLEDCDYDTEVFDQRLADWYEKKRERDEVEAKAQEDQRKAEQEWQNNLDSYTKKKADLKVKDFDDAEAFVQDNFSQMQQGMMIQGAENPALVFYALGKNPKKAKELSGIKDPVKFAFAVAKLETQLKVTNRKAATKPEKTIRGNAKPSGAVDSTLERLRAEAEKTGDYSKVRRYKQQKRAG